MLEGHQREHISAGRPEHVFVGTLSLSRIVLRIDDGVPEERCKDPGNDEENRS
jgi:hypothetical protein